MTKTIDISDQFTPAFFKDPNIKKGTSLSFGQKPNQRDFKIVRLNRSKRICIVEEIDLMTEQEMKDKFNKDRDEAVNKALPAQENTIE